MRLVHLQAVKVLSGEVSHFVADPKKGYTEEVQAAGTAISLFAVAQVILLLRFPGLTTALKGWKQDCGWSETCPSRTLNRTLNEPLGRTLCVGCKRFLRCPASLQNIPLQSELGIRWKSFFKSSVIGQRRQQLDLIQGCAFFLCAGCIKNTVTLTVSWVPGTTLQDFQS